MPTVTSVSLLTKRTEIKPIVESFVEQFFAKWQRQMKLAMVIGQALDHVKELGYDVTDIEVGDIIYQIIRDKSFVTFGDITKWRHSEIVPQEFMTPEE